MGHNIRRRKQSACEKQLQEDYTMKKLILKVLTAILAATLATAGICAALAAAKEPTGWDVSFPMCNRNIEWTGAGYSRPGR